MADIRASQILAQVEYATVSDVTIVADPIILTVSVFGNWAADTNISADPIILTVSILGSWSASIAVVADPIVSTISIHGDWVHDLAIVADPIVITISHVAILSQWPSGPRNPDLDIEFDCSGRDRFGNQGQGIPVFTVGVGGTWLNKAIVADPVNVVVSQVGSLVSGFLFESDPIVVTIGLKTVDVVTELFKTNWVKWSDIGYLDFAIGRDNVAGERPLDWKGWIYAIRKLGNRVVVYGENGVSLLIPSETTYGLQTIHRIGLKGKGAVSGDDSVHFFVDNLGQLWRFSEGLEKLDYFEYLGELNSNLVLSWDVANQLLYICDGVRGYVYSQDSGSLGAGPVSVTGIDSQSGVLYVVSPTAIVMPSFEIITDVYDLGSRRGKNIYSLEIGTDLTETLEAAIEYRLDKSEAFAVTDWHVVDPRGMAYIPVHGREFRFKIKSDVYNYFEVDYITINGEVCGN